MYATLYTLGAFTLILILARLKVPLAISIIIGAVTIGLLFQMTLIDIALGVAKGIVQPRTIGLVIITAFILALSAIMDSTGQLKEIVTLARQLLRRCPRSSRWYASGRVVRRTDASTPLTHTGLLPRPRW